jgi:GNAT superfamily N-acetyltransferase
MKLIDVTNSKGDITEMAWMLSAEAVHRQLRTNLPLDYVMRMQQVFANGARMLVVAEHENVVGVALWRLVENTYEGQRLYIDDLVTDESQRGKGIGKLLVQQLEKRARDIGCDVLVLDSGVQRAAAHKFYFREGMYVASFSFRKSLK